MKKPAQHAILTLERFLPYRLSILSNSVSETIAGTYRDKYALSITEWRIMAILGEYPDASADEVCRRTQIEKSLVSRAVTKLLHRKLIEKEIHEQDKRRSKLTLTELGSSVYDELVPISYTYEKRLMKCFKAEERKQFSKLIDRLYQQAEILRHEQVVD
ncbi:MAG: MarR family transcriptional regulator [Pseudomonadales bacterium]